MQARASSRDFCPAELAVSDWERIIDTIPDAIAICDEHGRVVGANRALRDISGRSREELLDLPLDEVLPPLSLQALVRESLGTAGVVVCDEAPSMHGRTYAATISPIAGADAVGSADPGGPSAAVVLLRDVTDERRMQRRLLLGERMAAVGQLAAGLAHEINNPVSFAYSNLQMAKGLLQQHQSELSPALCELLEMIDECMVGMARVRDIVRDLRTFTSTEVRSGAGEVRLDDIIDLGLRLMRSEVQSRARLVYERELLPTPPVRGDAGKLTHVLLNLLNQALHNLPPTDEGAGANVITVRTRHCPERDEIELTVADTGPTLSDELRAHLFEPFAQRRVRLPPGLSAAIGMGLAVSYEVVRRHGGEIEVRPGAGGGNEIIVRLPLHRDKDLRHKAEPASRARVLFVDDDPLLLRSYRRLLEDAYDVTTVSSAREALDLLSGGESFDIIFCDLVMPVMDGAKLYRAVAERDTACAQRFVFLANGPITPEITDFLNQVDNPHVDKPVGRESLVQAMETLRSASEP